MNSVLHNNQFGQVSKTSLAESIEGVNIEHDHCSAKISLYGGQVLAWQPKNKQAIFWLSDDTPFMETKAIRGGIPLCWPWFGSYSEDQPTAGNHGFARQQQWQVESIDIEENSVDITLIWQGANVHPLWSNACQLKQVFKFGETFSQTLSMTNNSDDDCEYTGALHSYFQISDPKNVTVDSLSTAKFDDKITGVKNNQPQQLDNCVGPLDRIYHSDQLMQLVDKEWQRVIEIESFNAKQWVLWNPGVEVAATMSDIHKNGQQEFVCLEVANTQAQILKAGETRSMGQAIRVLPL